MKFAMHVSGLALSLALMRAFAEEVPPAIIELARKAKLAFKAGHYAEAEKIYRQALDREPDNLYLIADLANVHFRSGQLKLAETGLKKVLAAAPRDDVSHCQLGEVYHAQGQLPEAVNEFKTALELNPQNTTARHYLDPIAAEKERMELAPAKPPGNAPGAEKKPAIRLEVDPVVLDPSDRKPGTIPGPGVKTAPEPAVPPELIGLAREAKDQFERGNYREAEKIYQKALAKAPNNFYFLSNQGVVYFRGQKYKLAEEAFKKAIAIAPEDDFSHCTLGIVYYSQGKLDEAINELTKALAINPKNATAHNYLGITASQKGWQEAAMKEFETATALDPSLGDSTYRTPAVSPTIGDYLTPLEKSRLRIPPSGYRPVWQPATPPARQ